MPTIGEAATTGAGCRRLRGGSSGRASPAHLLLHHVEDGREERAALPRSAERAAVRRVELVEELRLALRRRSAARPVSCLCALHAAHQLEPPVQGVEHLAVERSDPVAQI